jgi:hypothetical protein
MKAMNENEPISENELVDDTWEWRRATADFAIVVSSTSMVDNDLRLRLLNHCRELPKGLEERMFEVSGGALATLSNRSVMAYALNLIDRETLTHLDAIRRIRNEFAHQPRLTYFKGENAEVDKFLKILGWKPGQDRLRFWFDKIHDVKKKVSGEVEQPRP